MSELVSVAPAIAKRARRQRWNQFAKYFPYLDKMTVLDLGGTLAFWYTAPVLPRQLTIVNHVTDPLWKHDSPWLAVIVGDACDPPLPRLQGYDLVFSNSVIGHLGGHYRRDQFAEIVAYFGENHWIQTPYRYFPIDSFMACPGFMSMPIALRTQISLHWPIGTRRAQTKQEAVARNLEVEFLSKTEMQYYFPDSTIVTERFAGLTKSLIAVRN